MSHGVEVASVAKPVAPDDAAELLELFVQLSRVASQP